MQWWLIINYQQFTSYSIYLYPNIIVVTRFFLIFVLLEVGSVELNLKYFILVINLTM